MKQNKTLYTSIASVILDALKKYASMERRSVVTDIYLQPNMQKLRKFMQGKPVSEKDVSDENGGESKKIHRQSKCTGCRIGVV